MIIGPSGLGKTTLMDIVTGLLIPDQGKIWMDGQDVGEVDRAAWYNSIAYVSQDSVFTIHH